MTRALVLSDCAAVGASFHDAVAELCARFEQVVVAVDERSRARTSLVARWARARALLRDLPAVLVTALVDTPALSLPRDRVAALSTRLGLFGLLATDDPELAVVAEQSGVHVLRLSRVEAVTPALEPRARRALVVSRAQPFHRGHLALVERALASVDEVVFVIAAAERAYTIRDPYSAGERLRLVRAGLGVHAARTWLLALPAPEWPAMALAQLAFVAPAFELVVAHNPILRAMAADAGKTVLGLAEPFAVAGNVLSARTIRARLCREGAGAWLEAVLPAPCAQILLGDSALSERCALIARADV